MHCNSSLYTALGEFITAVQSNAAEELFFVLAVCTPVASPANPAMMMLVMMTMMMMITPVNPAASYS